MLALFLPVGVLITAGLLILSALSLHSFLLQLIRVAVGGALHLVGVGDH